MPALAQDLDRIGRRPRLADDVAERLRERIAAAGLAPGDRLPVERELAAVFGVSRAVVREAVARLKADGLVETRQGSGAFVATRRPSAPFRLAEAERRTAADLRQIFELRMVLELGVAELAARRRTAKDLAAMERALAAMDAALAAHGDGADADDAFHGAMAAATHNGYVSQLVAFLCGHFSDSRKLACARETQPQANPRAAQAEHRRLFAAVAAGDAAKARRLSRAHLAAAAARVGIRLGAGLDPGREKKSC